MNFVVAPNRRFARRGRLLQLKMILCAKNAKVYVCLEREQWVEIVVRRTKAKLAFFSRSLAQTAPRVKSLAQADTSSFTTSSAQQHPPLMHPLFLHTLTPIGLPQILQPNRLFLPLSLSVRFFCTLDIWQIFFFLTIDFFNHRAINLSFLLILNSISVKLVTVTWDKLQNEDYSFVFDQSVLLVGKFQSK